jgi:hypothetical protein
MQIAHMQYAMDSVKKYRSGLEEAERYIDRARWAISLDTSPKSILARLRKRTSDEVKKIRESEHAFRARFEGRGLHPGDEEYRIALRKERESTNDDALFYDTVENSGGQEAARIQIMGYVDCLAQLKMRDTDLKYAIKAMRHYPKMAEEISKIGADMVRIKNDARNLFAENPALGAAFNREMIRLYGKAMV